MPEPNANHVIASQLREAARLLSLQGANPFRVDAYRRAAETLEGLGTSVSALFDAGGTDALVELSGVGTGIAGAIREMLATGRWSMLERLRGAADPEQAFRLVPGIGPRLARRLHEELHIDTLEELEIAAHGGGLQRVRGFGPRRVAGIKAALAQRLGRHRAAGDSRARPSVELLIEVDGEYRRRAAAGELRAVAPRRFNPESTRWLPILHSERGGWHFTVLFSNTERAHRLGRTDDWVVIYYYDDQHREGQATVVTERLGPLAGRRVVRGRETEGSSGPGPGSLAPDASGSVVDER